jgi:RHS repeat-associated protein
VSNSPSATTSAGSASSETESFGYDILDRLTSVSGAYSESYSYNQIGNMLSKNGSSYTYPSNGVRPHAVSAVGSTSYAYDANGNMTTRGSQTITWDVENRPGTVTGGASFVYDGDGNRVKKTEGGQDILYVNKFFEKNLTTGIVTTSYYLGDRLMAQRAGATLQYIHQDHLTGTSAVSTSGDALVSSISYGPWGSVRSGSVPTDKQFTGQRLDGTGLYYYGARYYDPTIGRFISPDTIVSKAGDPQAWNRYSYVLNSPLMYTDPSGHDVRIARSAGVVISERDGTTYYKWQTNSPSADVKTLIQAWETFKSVAPNEAKVMESASKTYVIGRQPFDSGSITVGPLGETTYIGLQAGLNDVSLLAGLIAHESVHARQGHQANSVEEEVEAYQFGDKINQNPKLMVDDKFSAQFRSFDFTLKNTNKLAYRKALENAQAVLANAGLPAGRMYGNLPLEPGEVPDWINVQMMAMDVSGGYSQDWIQNMYFAGY